MIRAMHGIGAAALTLALAATSIGSWAPAAATVAESAPSWQPSRQVNLTWTATHVASDHHYTRRQAVALARRFDVITAIPFAFERYVGAMRRANPSLKLLVYTNATFANREIAASAPEHQFAHDQRGRRITSRGFGQYLMEPSDPGWQRRSVQECVSRLDRSGYDGCMLDMLGMAVYSPGYVSALPVDPDTGATYTGRQWRRRLMNLAGEFRAHRPALTYAGNAVGNAYRYWVNDVSSRPIVHSLPAAVMEDFLRGARDGVDSFPVRKDWRRNLAVIRDFEANDRTGLFMTKLWVEASPRQVRRWEAYTLATFLLAADGHTHLSFTDGRTKAAVAGRDLPFRMRRHLGRPTSGIQVSHGVHRRHFRRGLVVVNPTRKAHRIRLHGTFRTLDGDLVRRLRLAPHSGEVLRARRG
ncbi:MAG TPA: putative glycoside hydrolase [Nocardioidaceae bacterium]|nr:putative glycoside hydrolase [Nocardioidaceae bacterium]